jgi:transposase
MSLNKSIIEEILGKSKSVTLVAKEFGVSRKTIYKWIKEYKNQNDDIPVSNFVKNVPAHNRISSEIENLVIEKAKRFPEDGIVDLRDKLEEDHDLKLNPTTVYRILKRNNVRYVKGMSKV